MQLTRGLGYSSVPTRRVLFASVILLTLAAALVAGTGDSPWAAAGVAWIYALALVCVKGVAELANAQRRAFESAAKTSAEIAQLRVQLDILEDQTAQADERELEQRDRLQELESRAEAVSVLGARLEVADNALARIDGGLEDLRRVTTERHAANARRLERERRSRHVAFAARDSSQEMPNRLLLQMTINRTGSTRLFDILRCHPDVYLEPLDFIWGALGLKGRRYPVGLSDLPGASTSIVTQDEIGVAIRSMTARHAGCADDSHGAIAVEKAHPQFFDFNNEQFLERLGYIEQHHGVAVDLLYQIRRPLDVMWSMAEYKLRDPSWTGALTIDAIPEFIARGYQSLEALSVARSGIVVDYEDVEPHSRKMLDLGLHLNPAMEETEVENWLAGAFEATSRSHVETTAFVGEHARRVPEGPDGVWRHSAALLLECERAYEQVLGAGSGWTGSRG